MTERENNHKSNATSVTGELLTLFFDQVTGNFKLSKEVGTKQNCEVFLNPHSSAALAALKSTLRSRTCSKNISSNIARAVHAVPAI